MPGLLCVLCAWVLSSVLVSGANATGGRSGDQISALRPGSTAAQRPNGSEVDAFLGLWRSARIAQVIPNHAHVCLPSAGGSLATEAQRAIAASVAVMAESPLGAWLVDEAANRLVLICQDPNTDLAAYYRSQIRLIGLFERLPDRAKIMFLAHELAHVPQHPRFSNDLRFGAHAVLVVERMREASAEAVATRVLWQLRARGHAEPWEYKLASAYGDIARAFAQAMDEPGDARELRATRAAFDQWFGQPGRLHSYDARTLAYLASTGADRPSLAHPARTLTDSFLRGIGWYGGDTFLAPGDGPALTNPYYARGLSPATAARLFSFRSRAVTAPAMSTSCQHDGSIAIGNARESVRFCVSTH
jgi:hypothetical protein